MLRKKEEEVKYKTKRENTRKAKREWQRKVVDKERRNCKDNDKDQMGEYLEKQVNMKTYLPTPQSEQTG